MKHLLWALLFIAPIAYADLDLEVAKLAKEMNVAVETPTTETPKRIIKLPEFNIYTFLWFSGCRISQDEWSHIKKENGSMYALDFACGKDFPIVAPNYLYWEYKYIVRRVGRDKYLWDYVTIDFALPDWSGTLVYGHTKTELKVWDTLKAWELLWYYNPTWVTTWPHAHVELRKWGKNFTFDRKHVNPKSLRLRVQRGWASYGDEPIAAIKEVRDLLFRAMKFIIHFEGFRAKAYKDGGTRYSIWYWTKSFSWEVISPETARQRMEVAVKDRLYIVNSDYPNATENQKIALTSLLYNCPAGYRKVKREWATKTARTRCSTSQGKFNRGLYNRRLQERDKYNTP